MSKDLLQFNSTAKARVTKFFEILAEVPLETPSKPERAGGKQLD